MSFLSNLKLTIMQWVSLTMAGAIGVLVLLLDQKGSALHRAQVQLLEAHMDTQQLANDQKVQAAKDRYGKVRQDYLDSHGGSQ